MAIEVLDSLTTSPPDVAANAWLTQFVADLNRVDFCLGNSFTDDCYWRDLLAFSPNFRTIRTLPKLQHFFAKPVSVAQPHNFRIVPGVRIRQPVPSKTFIQGLIQFETAHAQCFGVFTLTRTGSSWKAWALVTMVDSMKGMAEHFNATNSIRRCRTNTSVKDEYVTLVVGAGQCGLSAAARLENLGISTLVIEKSARVGDNWRSRYDSLEVNTPRSFSHLPFLPFPESWGQFFCSTDVADHLEKYPDFLGLHISTSTCLLKAVYNPRDKKWTVDLRLGDGSVTTVSVRHIIAATGADTLAGASPIMPATPNSALFNGVIMHSDDYRSSRSWQNKKVVIVGAGCAGHDIAQDLANHGSEVVLAQRSPTAVISRETLFRFFPGLYFGENLPPTEVADRYWVALPLSASRTVQQEIMANISHIDKELTSSLAEKGYLLPGPSDNFLHRLLIRRGGYYIDRGCCELIISGKITMKAGNEITTFTSNGVIFSDGSEVDADLVVFATGYSSTTIREIAKDVFGEQVAAGVDDVGGWDDEWEYAGLWRPSGHPGLWFAGGDLFTARFYSRFLAFQILAQEKGLHYQELI
ncbi:putative dimethylaniline monooxygenase (N-oxide-forming) [Phlebopus sp. FC_14]|nr:putative dimethylaniline monooxygenase (N-oxide-forming) [Phlebopus sp. FC_14]